MVRHRDQQPGRTVCRQRPDVLFNSLSGCFPFFPFFSWCSLREGWLIDLVWIFFECLCFLRSFATRFLSSQQSCVECGPQPHLNLDFSPKNGVNDLRLQPYIQKVIVKPWAQNVLNLERTIEAKASLGAASSESDVSPSRRWATLAFSNFLISSGNIATVDELSHYGLKMNYRLKMDEAKLQVAWNHATQIFIVWKHMDYIVYTPLDCGGGVICSNGIYWSHWRIYREYLLPPVACVDMST